MIQDLTKISQKRYKQKAQFTAIRKMYMFL